MSNFQASAGYFRNGLPYNWVGHGPQILVVLQGLVFEHKPLTERSARFMLSTYSFLQGEYTTYVVTRKTGLPRGYSMRDMADDYAVRPRAFPMPGSCCMPERAMHLPENSLSAMCSPFCGSTCSIQGAEND